MKIGIIGTGIVGRSHAEKLISLNHNVMIGTRNVERTLAETKTDSMGNVPFSEWLKDNPTVQLGTFDEAAKFGVVVINALRGEVVLDAFANLNKQNFDNKVLIDISNALDFSKGMPPTLLVRDGNSIGEQLQGILPKAKVVKTLNTITARLQINPLELANGDHHVFISGNDTAGKKTAETILKSYGWKYIIDLGDITTARGTEMMMPMWLRLWGAVGKPMFNYKIIK
ncbi:NAD(P)-binding domain-containing protein [Candidatus Falkowbacteria bacterium]|nr:NAD(P)-binding domain-containing protein [Candidatus Falkowbacteria bacterium]